MRSSLVLSVLFVPWVLFAAEKPFTMLTDELLAKLPEAQRAEWTAYLAKSRAFAETEHRILDEERTKADAKPARAALSEDELRAKIEKLPIKMTTKPAAATLRDEEIGRAHV